MKKTSLPYLMTVKGRTYFRRGRGKTVRLPDPSEDGFLEAYDAAKRGKPRAPTKTTIGALIDEYQRSPKWASLAPRTKRDYGGVLAHIRIVAGNLDVSNISRPGVLGARDRNSHRRRFANYLVQLYSIIAEHAVDREHATGNALLIFELCLGTGQRIGDVLRMRWSDLEDGCIKVKQGKTGNELWIPLTPRLGRVLDAAPRGLYIVGAGFLPLSYRRASYAVGQVRDVQGLAAFTIHGLRHSTAAELAEAGCTDAQIAAVTGHKSLRMVAKYRAGSDQKRLAKEAMRMREE